MKKILLIPITIVISIFVGYAQTPDSMVSEGWTCVGNPECYEIVYHRLDGDVVERGKSTPYTYSLWVKSVGTKEYYSILIKYYYNGGKYFAYSMYMAKLKKHWVYMPNNGGGGGFPRDYHLQTFNAEFDSGGKIYVFDF